MTWAEHGGDRFVAAVENGPLCATQFHPEKSGDAGAALLRNWVGHAVSRLAADEQGARPASRRARARGRAQGGRPGRGGRSAASAVRPAPTRCAGAPPAGCRSAPHRAPDRHPGAGAAGSSASLVIAAARGRSTCWSGCVRPDWAARLAALVVSLLAAPVLVTLLVPRR